MGVVWSLTSGSASVPLWCYNEDFWLLKAHPLIMGNERGMVGSHTPQLTYFMWLGVSWLGVSFFSSSVHHLKLVGIPTVGGESFYWH